MQPYPASCCQSTQTSIVTNECSEETAITHASVHRTTPVHVLRSKLADDITVSRAHVCVPCDLNTEVQEAVRRSGRCSYSNGTSTWSTATRDTTHAPGRHTHPGSTHNCTIRVASAHKSPPRRTYQRRQRRLYLQTKSTTVSAVNHPPELPLQEQKSRQSGLVDHAPGASSLLENATRTSPATSALSVGCQPSTLTWIGIYGGSLLGFQTGTSAVLRNRAHGRGQIALATLTNVTLLFTRKRKRS